MAVRQYVAGASSATGTATVSITTTGAAATIVVQDMMQGSGTLTAPTATGLTFHVGDAPSGNLACYYAYNVSPGAYTISVSVGGFCSCLGPGTAQVVAYELDAPAGGGDPLDQAVGGQCLTGTTHWTGSSVTTTSASEVAIAFCGSVSAANASLSLGGTWSGGTLHTNAFVYGSAAEVLATTATINADFNGSITAIAGNAIFLGLATFKSSSGVAANTGSFLWKGFF